MLDQNEEEMSKSRFKINVYITPVHLILERLLLKSWRQSWGSKYTLPYDSPNYFASIQMKLLTVYCGIDVH